MPHDAHSRVNWSQLHVHPPHVARQICAFDEHEGSENRCDAWENTRDASRRDAWEVRSRHTERCGVGKEAEGEGPEGGLSAADNRDQVSDVWMERGDVDAREVRQYWQWWDVGDDDGRGYWSCQTRERWQRLQTQFVDALTSAGYQVMRVGAGEAGGVRGCMVAVGACV